MAKNPPGFTLNSFTAPSFGNIGSNWYKNVQYSDAKNIIKEKMLASAENFVAIGFYLKQIKEKEQYKEDGYDSIWSCAYAEFQLSQSAASRYINICKKFSVDGNSPMLDERYKSFSRSQLQEMLTIKDEKVLENLKPEMTTKEIREQGTAVKQSKKSSTNKNLDKDEPIQQEKLAGQMTIEGEFREFLPKENEENEIVDTKSVQAQIETNTNRNIINEKDVQEFEKCAEKLSEIMERMTDTNLFDEDLKQKIYDQVLPALENLINKAEEYKKIIN